MKILIKNRILIGIFITLITFVACDKEDDHSSVPIKINAIYLQDAQSNTPDRKVDFIRLGQIMRIEGSGFLGLRHVYINGYDTYFNPVYVSDNSMLIQVSSRNTPVSDADEDARNTIRLVKTAAELVYPFEIRAAAPVINRISHTLPLPGEPITLYGSGLQEIERVVFPGDIEISEGIVSDLDGEFVRIEAVPDNLTEWGSIFVEGANGGAYSPAYFNFKEGVIFDFDGKGEHGHWGSASSMITPEDLESNIIGSGNISQGTYVAHRPERISSFNAGANRLSEVWTAGNDVDDWRGNLTPFIPPSTPINMVGFQFDIFVPEAWSGSGFLKILLINNYNGGEWSGYTHNYVPWIVDKEVHPFITEGWETVTIPFNKFYEFEDTSVDFTFEDVLLARDNATWENFGFYFENSDFILGQVTRNNSDDEEFESFPVSLSVYTDNWRVVSLHTPAYSDFPDDEED